MWRGRLRGAPASVRPTRRNFILVNADPRATVLVMDDGCIARRERDVQLGDQLASEGGKEVEMAATGSPRQQRGPRAPLGAQLARHRLVAEVDPHRQALQLER